MLKEEQNSVNQHAPWHVNRHI